MDDKNRSHVSLRTSCGICGGAFLAGVSFVPLLGGDISAEFAPGLDKPAIFSSHNYVILFDRVLCWAPNCWRCGSSPPEAVGIHSDCFSLFREGCKSEDALERLRTAGLSRSPWPGAPNLRLNRASDLAVELVYEKAEQYGIPGLKLLPTELIQIVRDYSEAATFWRYISVLNYSRELSDTPMNTNLPSSITSMPLCEITAWERGREPTVSGSSDRLPILRLTIDYRGIKQLKRLPEVPSFQPGSWDTLAFVTQEESELKNVTAHFKDSAFRLELPERFRGFHIWDMPNPPSLEDCKFCGHIPQSTRFRTLDLRGATGITFFFAFNKVYAIHAHTPMVPYALRTFNRLSERRRGQVTWVYLPIPRGEEIIAFGVRAEQVGGRVTIQKPCFVVRTKLAGDVSLGPYHRGEYKDIILSQRPPTLLIYNSVDVGPATVFGTYSPEGYNDSSFVTFRRPRRVNIPAEHANHSTAPLQNVTRIQVFTDENNGFCRAILLDYENGAQRALGNCRLGVDPVKTYLSPSRICYFRTSYLRRAVRFESGCDSTHRHDEDTWVCGKMEGDLEFRFTDEECISVRIVGTED